jgi:hypothetical protein
MMSVGRLLFSWRLGREGLTRIFTDDTDQEQATAASLTLKECCW